MLKKRYWKPIAGIMFLIMFLAAVLFFYYLLITDLLIPEYLALVTAVVVLFVYGSGVLLFYGMRKKPSSHRRFRRIIGVVLAILTSVVCLIGAYLLSGINNAKEEVVKTESDTPRAVLGVFVKKDDPAQDLSTAKDYTYGVILLGDEGLNTNHALGVINRQLGKEISVSVYPSISDAAAALRDDSIQALLVNKFFISILKDTESYKTLSDEIRCIEEIPIPSNVSLENTNLYVGKDVVVDTSRSRARTDKNSSVDESGKSTTLIRNRYGENTPLIFYISGMDNAGQEVTNAHSDVNILLLFNSQTKQIFMVNTPRDYYVLNPALGGGDKLTHCGYQGVYNSIAALEDLYRIRIDNYCRLNYDGFIGFIDAIGGITLDNPTPFWNHLHTHYFESGTLTLDGESALLFAREREAFGDGDLARGRNQIRVITAIINKMKTSGATILMNYTDILDSMAGSFETDLTSQEISDLVKVVSKDLSNWDVKSYSVSGYSGMRETASTGNEILYILFPKQDTVEFASELIEMVLNNEYITDDILANAPSPY